MLDCADVGLAAGTRGALQHSRLVGAFGLPIEPSIYRDLHTAREIARMLEALRDDNPVHQIGTTNSSSEDTHVEKTKAAAQADKAVGSYADTFRTHGVDGVLDRAYSNAWSALWG